MTTKIATCCYCGSRTALKLTARGGHELACGKCGAPLHEMKAMPGRSSDRNRKKNGPVMKYEREHPRGDWQGGKEWQGRDRDDDDRKRRKKRRKPMWHRALEEAFDVIEDIFD